MKKLLFTTLALAAVALPPVWGQTADELKIKERSSFTRPASARNPFMPIGWQPAGAPAQVAGKGSAAPAAVPAEAFFKPENFTVTSISIGALPLAMVNGKAYGEGDLIAINAGGKNVSVEVFSIRDGEVILRYQGRMLVAAIRTSAPGSGGKPAARR